MEKILVIEDNLHVRQNIVEILKLKDYEIAQAENGREALMELGKEDYDLVISDIMMPEMDGIELVKKVREEKQFDLPFIFLTAKADMQDLRKGMNYGADDYISKPFKAMDLLKSVELRLKKSKKNKERLENLRRSMALYVPHELSSPIFPIRGYSQFIMEEINNLTKEEIFEIISDIDNSGSRLQSIVDKFIKFSELHIDLEEQTKKYAEEKFSELEATLETVVNTHTENSDRKKDINIDVQNASVKVAESHFKTIVEELTENALKFSKAGDPIIIESDSDEKNYYLKFRNQGYDISPDQINEVGAFVQFSRNSDSKAGNGLGLAIAQMILKIHDGKMKIEIHNDKTVQVTVVLEKINQNSSE